MTTELKRLTEALGAPDFQLREIQREQRLMDAASRWPILRDVAPEYAPASRPINVNLGMETPAKPNPGVVRLQTKQSEEPQPVEKKQAVSQAGKGTIKGQLSNVFLRLKRDNKSKDKRDGDKIAVL